jgi:hypothetical protein
LITLLDYILDLFVADPDRALADAGLPTVCGPAAVGGRDGGPESGDRRQR